MELASKLKAMARTNIDVVFAPALGGLIIGHEVARALDVPLLFTERDQASGQMTLRRGFEVQSDKAAVVVEDVITTGGSSREVVELIRSAGGKVVAGGSIIDRSGGRADIGVPRINAVLRERARALAEKQYESKLEQVGPEMFHQFERNLMLTTLDSQWREEEKRNKRFYRLSTVGKAALKQLTAEWKAMNAALGEIL